MAQITATVHVNWPAYFWRLFRYATRHRKSVVVRALAKGYQTARSEASAATYRADICVKHIREQQQRIAELEQVLWDIDQWEDRDEVSIPIDISNKIQELLSNC